MNSYNNFASLAKALKQSVNEHLGPPEEGLPSNTQDIVPMSVVRGTRVYIEKVTNQIDGTYEYR